MSRTITMPAVAAVRQVQRNAKNTYVLCDSIADYADTTEGYRNGPSDWSGGMGGHESTKCLREGNLAGVAAADAMLDKIESLLAIETKAYRTFHDVCGGAPNVGAFLAGTPECMRYRKRVAMETAPLAVAVDLTSSGSIEARDVQRRGCAILALVRALSQVRPVELLAVIGLGYTGKAVELVTRIDTTPLDLARAAHFLTHPSVSRCLGYGYLTQVHKSGGGWNFGDIDLQRRTARESLSRVITANSDILYIPPVFENDQCIKQPEVWLEQMIAKHGGIEREAA